MGINTDIEIELNNFAVNLFHKTCDLVDSHKSPYVIGRVMILLRSVLRNYLCVPVYKLLHSKCILLFVVQYI